MNAPLRTDGEPVIQSLNTICGVLVPNTADQMRPVPSGISLHLWTIPPSSAFASLAQVTHLRALPDADNGGLLDSGFI
jgi:hypothetical protein